MFKYNFWSNFVQLLIDKVNKCYGGGREPPRFVKAVGRKRWREGAWVTGTVRVWESPSGAATSTPIGAWRKRGSARGNAIWNSKFVCKFPYIYFPHFGQTAPPAKNDKATSFFSRCRCCSCLVSFSCTLFQLPFQCPKSPFIHCEKIVLCCSKIN